MLAMNKNVTSTTRSMDQSRSKLARIGVILSFGILLEIASYAVLTDAAPDNLPENVFEASKRAGFVGMRGKKSDNDGEMDPLAQMMYSSSWPSLHKRAGFVGMRGKKSYGFDNQGDLLQYLAMMYKPQPQPELKRAGFVGMRGKKSINDESTLSKRAAFVGMRGRRTPQELGYDDLYNYQDIEDLAPRERRAGFVGMRG